MTSFLLKGYRQTVKARVFDARTPGSNPGSPVRGFFLALDHMGGCTPVHMCSRARKGQRRASERYPRRECIMGGRGSGSGMKSGAGFKSFSDKARDSHEYEGDGEDVVKFFKENSNYDELIDGMTPGQKGAFRDWTAGWFMDGQQYGGWDSMSRDEKESTQIFDDVLDRATLSQGVVLSRRSTGELVLGAGKKTGSLSDFQAMEGQIITSKGSMSFGAAAEGLTIGTRGKTVEYKLKIPGGTRGSGMWIGDHRINGWGADQREFMTNRDIALKVGKTTYDRKRGVYTVNLEYVGRLEHDYGTTGRVKGRFDSIKW